MSEDHGLLPPMFGKDFEAVLQAADAGFMYPEEVEANMHLAGANKFGPGFARNMEAITTAGIMRQVSEATVRLFYRKAGCAMLEEAIMPTFNGEPITDDDPEMTDDELAAFDQVTADDTTDQGDDDE